MRTLLLTLVLLLPLARAFPQGTVAFNNFNNSRLTTNDFQGNFGFISGVNAYRIGLYVAPVGSGDPNVFTLMAPTTFNHATSIGIFNGNPFSGFFVISNNVAEPIAFQVRAWSSFAGNTWAEAMLYAGPESVFAGTSDIGETIPAIGLSPPPILFGTFGGMVGGFTLTPIIPEPSTWALVVVGASVLWFATRARRRKSFPPPSRPPE